MAKPKITLGLPDHPRCQAIIDGKVGIEGYELAVDPHFSSGERHYKYLRGEWDVGEVSAASLLRAIEKGQQLVAIPVFFERGPRQRNIYHCEKHLTHPSELKGKKFGCFRYGATAVVWARGYLLDAHRIKTTDMQWFVSGREVFIGSQSLRAAELDSRRELGLIVRDAKAVNQLIETFESDWGRKRSTKVRKGKDKGVDSVDGESEKAVKALTKELSPIVGSVKKAVKKAVAHAGDEVLHDKALKNSMKKVVKRAVKDAVQEAVQERKEA